MEAEIRLDEVADLIRLELERRILEGAHHHPAREEAEVAALGRRARIAGIFLRELREAARRFAQLREDLRGALPCARLFSVARVPLHGDQDMARTALLRLAVLGNVRLVIRLDLVRADLLRGKQSVGAQHEVFDIHLLGHLEASRIAVVERADRVRRDFGLRELRVGLDSILGDLALLCAQLRKLAGDRLRCEP